MHGAAGSLALLGLLASAPAASAALVCGADALCPAGVNPCTISGSHQVGELCVLDFGTRSITVVGSLTAELPAGQFSVVAGNLILQGGSLRAQGTTGGPGGDIGVTVTGAFVMTGSGPRINVTAPGGSGSVAVSAGSIDIQTGAPAITASATSGEGDGGAVTLAATGSLRVASPINATGGNDSCGGQVDLTGGSVQIESPINVAGGSCDGGVITILAMVGDVTTLAVGHLEANAGSFEEIGGAGGEILLGAAGSILTLGDIRAQGALDSDGGLLEMTALGDITVGGPVHLDGGLGGGAGGVADLVAAGTIRIQDPIDVEGRGNAEGGSITMSAGGSIEIENDVSAAGNGADADGGGLDLWTDGGLVVAADIDASGGSASGRGGLLQYQVFSHMVIAAGGAVRLNGGLEGGVIARLSPSWPSPAAFTVDGVVEARGLGGGNGGFVDVGPHCAVVVNGTITAGVAQGGLAGGISFTAGSVTIAPGATIDPPATTVVLDPDTRPCCGNAASDPGETCDDGNTLHCDGCSAECAPEPSPPCADDGNPCTTVRCDPVQGCVLEPLTGPACPDDGSQCTEDVCVAGTCSHPAVACDDGIGCTIDGCDPASGCTFVPVDDLCDDGNSCAVAMCDPDSGCLAILLPDGSACTDLDVCTTGDTCQGGVCTPLGVPLQCDDGDHCTIDSCDPVRGCLNPESAMRCPCAVGGIPVPAGTPCADGSLCTFGETCNGAGQCLGGVVPDCDDGDPCTIDLCLFAACVHADSACPTECGGQPDGLPCSDGSPCTTAQCESGQCVATPVQCDDGDPCNGTEICVSAQGLGCRGSFGPTGVPCDDGDACTRTDTCQAGACVGADPIECTALDQCHDAGACNPGTGVCSNPSATDGAPCDDGNLCTQGEVCIGGVCSIGSSVVCTALDQCHDAGVCDPVTGRCSDPVAGDGTPCDDGDVCTTGDACGAGVCIGGPPLACPACETCDPLGGCMVAPRPVCLQPVESQRALLVVRDNVVNDARDTLVWRWIRGEATTSGDFGDPLGSDDYSLCIFDHPGGAPRLVIESGAPHGGTCPGGPTGRSCWTALGTPAGIRGYKYRDRDRTPTGMDTMRLSPGGDGRARIVLRGKGAALALPSPLDFALPVTVQLQAANGVCWSAEYFAAGVLKDDGSLFRGKAGMP